MEVVNSVSSLRSQAAAAALLVLLTVAAVRTQTAKAQSCTTQLTNLNVCAPFVVPGATQTNPSPDCCAALQSVQHDCFCSTLSIASRLPSQCNLPPLTCVCISICDQAMPE
ncbi:stamen-specific protein FIL1-like [Hibiscus syriacus]|uniref:stamen-specific protein FIL1-like n=1 Tax=Hibiscus syriacus TaxID=106335 RepID=UPI0019233677|nr:stamen-specific protein FIL1-like [Hibiscus syriacus]